MPAFASTSPIATPAAPPATTPSGPPISPTAAPAAPPTTLPRSLRTREGGRPGLHRPHPAQECRCPSLFTDPLSRTADSIAGSLSPPCGNTERNREPLRGTKSWLGPQTVEPRRTARPLIDRRRDPAGTAPAPKNHVPVSRYCPGS